MLRSIVALLSLCLLATTAQAQAQYGGRPVTLVVGFPAGIPYDTLKDFAPITTLGITPGAIGVNNAVAARDLKQLMASTVDRDLRIASTGAGGMPHLTIELLKLGARPGGVVHVPYKGAALAVTDVMGGHVDGIVADLASLIGMFRDGRLRPVVVTGRERASFLPDVPTALEQGYTQLVAENWLGVLAPARTPPPIIDRLHEALRAIMQEPPVREQMLKVGYAVTPSPAPAEFQQFLRSEFEKWGKVARDSGARAD